MAALITEITSMGKTFLLIAAISGLLVVAIGAFGAHGLKGRVSQEMLAVFQTSVQYHFYHTFALLAVGILLLSYPQAGSLNWSGWLFCVGIVIFSGSLYVMTLTDLRWLGAITPLVGVALIAGWLMMVLGIYRHINV
jgi:uncharacterized membrane protein YgdD (TMEM256/DUF423 family)